MVDHELEEHPAEHPNTSEIPRATVGAELTAARFRSDFRSQMSVVFPGLLASWPACSRWAQRTHLEDALGGGAATVRVQTSPNNRIFNAVYHRAEDTEMMDIASVLDATLHAAGAVPTEHRVAAVPPAPGSARRMYCKLSLSAALSADMGTLPKGVFGQPKTLGPSVAGETTFWMGSQGVVTPLHFDHCHTVIAQVGPSCPIDYAGHSSPPHPPAPP